MLDDIRVKEFLTPYRQLLIQQVKEWGEIIINIETRNKYQILSPDGSELGFMAEQGKGFLGTVIRMLLRTHRPMDIIVWNSAQEEILRFERPFFWFFSDLAVKDSNGNILGHVYRKFGLIYKRYDLCLNTEKRFAHVESILWKLWTFFIKNNSDQEIGKITKSWGGLLKEMFTDADKFQVDFGDQSWQEKAVTLAAAISIDLDFFEDNQRSD